MNTEITSKLKTRRCAIGYLEEQGAKFAELCSSTAFGTLPINTRILVRPRVNMPWVLKHYKDFDYDSKDRVSSLSLLTQTKTLQKQGTDMQL